MDITECNSDPSVVLTSDDKEEDLASKSTVIKVRDDLYLFMLLKWYLI